MCGLRPETPLAILSCAVWGSRAHQLIDFKWHVTCRSLRYICVTQNALHSAQLACDRSANIMQSYERSQRLWSRLAALIAVLYWLNMYLSISLLPEELYSELALRRATHIHDGATIFEYRNMIRERVDDAFINMKITLSSAGTFR